MQRLALMQLGNFRFTTPEAGLNVVLGSLPLDLHLQELAMRTPSRLKHLNILDWQGKGPGSRGRPGHILRVETKLNNTGVNYQLTDAMPNTTMWENLYLVDENMDGNDITEGYRLYTDGSKLDENSGYGAALLHNDDVCDEVCGSIGTEATVFQAECAAILYGLDLLTLRDSDITILVDNQAVVNSLNQKVTSNKIIKEIKEELSNKCRTNNLNIKVKWIKAHIGFPGNEYADELAKKGTDQVPFGPEPIFLTNKTTIYNHLRLII